MSGGLLVTGVQDGVDTIEGRNALRAFARSPGEVTPDETPFRIAASTLVNGLEAPPRRAVEAAPQGTVRIGLVHWAPKRWPAGRSELASSLDDAAIGAAIAFLDAGETNRLIAAGGDGEPLHPLAILMGPADPDGEPAAVADGPFDLLAEATLVAQVCDARIVAGLGATGAAMRAGPERPMTIADFEETTYYDEGRGPAMTSSPARRAAYAAAAVAADLCLDERSTS